MDRRQVTDPILGCTYTAELLRFIFCDVTWQWYTHNNHRYRTLLESNKLQQDPVPSLIKEQTAVLVGLIHKYFFCFFNCDRKVSLQQPHRQQFDALYHGVIPVDKSRLRVADKRNSNGHFPCSFLIFPVYTFAVSRIRFVFQYCGWEQLVIVR